MTYSIPRRLEEQTPDPTAQLFAGLRALAEQVAREQIEAAIATSTAAQEPWPKCMPARQAAEYLGLSRSWFDTLTSRGEIPISEHMTQVAGHRMFLRDDLDAFAAGEAVNR